MSFIGVKCGAAALSVVAKPNLSSFEMILVVGLATTLQGRQFGCEVPHPGQNCMSYLFTNQPF